MLLSAVLGVFGYCDALMMIVALCSRSTLSHFDTCVNLAVLLSGGWCLCLLWRKICVILACGFFLIVPKLIRPRYAEPCQEGAEEFKVVMDPGVGFDIVDKVIPAKVEGIPVFSPNVYYGGGLSRVMFSNNTEPSVVIGKPVINGDSVFGGGYEWPAFYRNCRPVFQQVDNSQIYWDYELEEEEFPEVKEEVSDHGLDVMEEKPAYSGEFRVLSDVGNPLRGGGI